MSYNIPSKSFVLVPKDKNQLEITTEILDIHPEENSVPRPEQFDFFLKFN